ncbi:unnamed protein product [Pylaiella littoralis]
MAIVRGAALPLAHTKTQNSKQDVVFLSIRHGIIARPSPPHSAQPMLDYRTTHNTIHRTPEHIFKSTHLKTAPTRRGWAQTGAPASTPPSTYYSTHPFFL